MPPTPPSSRNGWSRCRRPRRGRGRSRRCAAPASRSSCACLTAATVSISASRVIVSGSMLTTTRARDVVDDDRQVARRRDRLEVGDDAALRRLVVVRRDDEERRRRRARAPARVRCTEWAVEYVPVPATTVAASPTASIAARIRSRRSLSVSVGLSPVVPATTIPSEPLSTRWRASRWNASKSTAPSSPNGVTIAVSTLPSMRWIVRLSDASAPDVARLRSRTERGR